MPTNDERRDVAARLRKAEIDNLGLTYSAHLGEAIGECVRLVSGHECLVEGGLNRLADLIEPEERTCRMTKKGPEFVLAGWWECSECGPVYPPCNDEIAVWALQKCPRCGAKVMEEVVEE